MEGGKEAKGATAAGVEMAVVLDLLVVRTAAWGEAEADERRRNEG